MPGPVPRHPAIDACTFCRSQDTSPLERPKSPWRQRRPVSTSPRRASQNTLAVGKPHNVKVDRGRRPQPARDNVCRLLGCRIGAALLLNVDRVRQGAFARRLARPSPVHRDLDWHGRNPLICRRHPDNAERLEGRRMAKGRCSRRQGGVRPFLGIGRRSRAACRRSVRRQEGRLGQTRRASRATRYGEPATNSPWLRPWFRVRPCVRAGGRW
jgi:hypothetical protein